MRYKDLTRIVSAVGLAVLAGCGSNSGPSLTGLSASPSTVTVKAGKTQALTVTGTYSDGTTGPLSSGLTFTSSNLAVATVSAAGVVTGVGAGSSSVTVASGTLTAVVTVTVTADASTPTVARLVITPSPVSLQKGSTQQLTVTATYSDATTGALSSGVTFTSSSGSFATVSSTGLVTAVAAGSATVVASASGKTADVSVTVTDATLDSITVNPPTVDLFIGHTQALTVQGSFSDGSSATVTTGVTFSSSDTNVAAVGLDGLVTGVAKGSATITATTASGKTNTATVNVTPSPYVFYGEFDGNTSFVGFGGATNDVAKDTTELRDGRPTLKAVVVASTGYSGGAIVSSSPRDLSGYDALTFWVKASKDTPIDVLGVGNDSAGTTGFEAELAGTSLTTTWQKVILPLVDPAKMTSIDGLFHFADKPKDYTVWFSDIQFEKLGAAVLGAPSATINLGSVAPALGVGDTFTLDVDLSIVDYTISGGLVRVTRPGWRYFTLTSDTPANATVSSSGVVTAMAQGTATITASLAGTAATGSYVVAVSPKIAPTSAPAAPTLAAANVISLSTAVYTNHAVDTWATEWSVASYEAVTIGGDTVRHYSALDYVGIATVAAGVIDLSAMTAFHVDVWTPNATSFAVKLVDFGADGVYGNGDDTEAKVTFDSTTTPALTTTSWVSLDIPFASFLAANPSFQRQHFAQLLFVGVPSGSTNVYVDNLYFHN